VQQMPSDDERLSVCRAIPKGSRCTIVQGLLTFFDVKGAGRRPNFVVVRDRHKSKPALLEQKKRIIPFSEQAAP
jgi:hypothetical protein